MSPTEYIITDTGKKLLRFIEDNPEALNRFKRPNSISALIQIANEGPLTAAELDDPTPFNTLMSFRQTDLVETI